MPVLQVHNENLAVESYFMPESTIFPAELQMDRKLSNLEESNHGLPLFTFGLASQPEI